MASFGLKDIEDAVKASHWFDRAVVEGNAYRISKRHTLADGEELTIHFVPVSAGGTIHIETPAITTPTACDIDVWENAEPDGSADDTADDLFVHAMRYDEAPEGPEATVQRVTDGSLATGAADQTEQTRVVSGEQYNTPGGEARRGLWRTIPVGETVSFIITDQSNGSGNVYGFDTVVYEGETFPD